MEEEIRKMLSLIVQTRMKIKAELNVYNFLSAEKKKSNESKINELLDKLNDLDKLEKELRKKL
ncbi:hypothetical protein IR083_10205 [Dysgonomonas sp. GY75]|uniref:hypothetical protein n=1 Tax=Dysgonomonas sp. GY75 TaxID=2780419 RepID=UPI001883FE39|nr:hypothetical protein [Dysgonomonas sp. GY75]MBF0649193.1 hypothetical protein [Dysgonomonas sp. GY75]